MAKPISFEEFAAGQDTSAVGELKGLFGGNAKPISFEEFSTPRPSTLQNIAGFAKEAAPAVAKDVAGSAVSIADMILGIPGMALGVGANVGSRIASVAGQALGSGETRREAAESAARIGERVAEPLSNPIGKIVRFFGGGDAVDASSVNYALGKLTELIDKTGGRVEEATGGGILKEDVAAMVNLLMLAGGAKGTDLAAQAGVKALAKKLYPVGGEVPGAGPAARATYVEPQQAAEIGQKLVAPEPADVAAALQSMTVGKPAQVKAIFDAIKKPAPVEQIGQQFVADLFEKAKAGERAAVPEQLRAETVAQPPAPVYEPIQPKTRLAEPVVLGEAAGLDAAVAPKLVESTPALDTALAKLREGKGWELTAEEKVALRVARTGSVNLEVPTTGARLEHPGGLLEPEVLVGPKEVPITPKTRLTEPTLLGEQPATAGTTLEAAPKTTLETALEKVQTGQQFNMSAAEKIALAKETPQLLNAEGTPLAKPAVEPPALELVTADGKPLRISRSQAGSVDPQLLARLGAVAGASALGAWLAQEDKWTGALVGAAAGGLLLGGGKQALERISTTVGEKSPALKLWMRDYELVRGKEQTRVLDQIIPFVEAVRKVKDPGTKQLVDQALASGDRSAISRMPGGEAVIKVLDDFDAAHKALGRYKEGIANYFPRRVKDLEGLKNALGGEVKTALEQVLGKAELEMQRTKGRSLTETEQSIIVNRFLQLDPSNSPQPGYAKARRLKDIPPELRKFYEDPTDTLIRYAGEATKDIVLAKAFGKDLVHRKVGGQNVTDLDASIGGLLNKELQAGRIKAQDIPELAKVLKARFGPGEKAPHPWVQDFRNVSNVLLLGQVISALTQTADAAGVIRQHGIAPTLKAVAKMATGKAELSVKDVGMINHIAEELTDGRLTGRALNKVLKVTAFSAIDAFAKNLNLQAGLLKNQKLAQTPKGVAELQTKWGDAFQERFPQLVEDLRRGKRTHDTDLLQFSELSDVQPISKMEMPLLYLQNPNGRLLYQMKTYMLSQMDIVRREAYDQFRKGNYAQGTKALLGIAAMLAVAEVPGHLIKEWMQGRPMDLSKIDWIENIAKNFGLNRYTMGKMGTPLEVARDIVVPPFKHYQELAQGGPRMVKYVPGVGRIVEARFLGGNERKAKYEAQQTARAERLKTETSWEQQARLDRQLKAKKAAGKAW